jgi:hypothetical protein
MPVTNANPKASAGEQDSNDVATYRAIKLAAIVKQLQDYCRAAEAQNES